MTEPTPVVLPLDPRSAVLADQLAARLGGSSRSGPASREPATTFASGRPFAAIAAAGIAAAGIAAAGIVVRHPTVRFAHQQRKSPVPVTVETALPAVLVVRIARREEQTAPCYALLRRGSWP